jgi:hypothetical protein
MTVLLLIIFQVVTVTYTGNAAYALVSWCRQPHFLQAAIGCNTQLRHIRNMLGKGSGTACHIWLLDTLPLQPNVL